MIDGGRCGGAYKCVNSAGQECVCVFTNEDGSYYMSFTIDGKWQNKIVGKAGLSSMLWAKQCLLDFITNFLSDNLHKSIKFNVCVRTSEKRRRAIYKRSLYPLGFKVDRYGTFYLKIKR